jgi:hypothetical protein
MGTNNLESLIVESLTRLEAKVDKITNEMVTKEDCKKNQELCNTKFKQKKIEIGPAKITAIGGIFITITGFIIAVIKIFFP